MIYGSEPIQGMSRTDSILPLASKRAKTESSKSFADHLEEAVKRTGELQAAADQKAAAFARGEDVDIHTVMIAAEKASIAFNYLVSVRNRLLESYQEIMRMQV